VAGAAALLASKSKPSNRSDALAIRSTITSEGNPNWADDSGDGTKEPLLDLSDTAVFNPNLIAGSGGGNGGGDDPPTVNITSPANGATVDGTISVTATAGDDNGVLQVEFFVDGASIGTDANGGDGWSMSWDTTSEADGNYSVSATATDTIGQPASDSLEVNVDNVADPPDGGATGVVLVGSSINNGSTWTAQVNVTVLDSDGNAVANATVAWSWSNGTTGSGTCSTGLDGKCGLISRVGIPKRTSGVTFTVNQLNGVADGTSIVVNKP
jgi:hypothetical protein